ncbi:MAG: ATP-binding protein [Sterolibacterium sp.]
MIVLSLFVAGIAANAIHSSRLDHVELARTATQNLSLVFETEIADIFDHTDLALKNLADNYADNLRANRFPDEKWNAELQRQRSYLKILNGMRATDSSGTVVFGLNPGDARNVSVADRDYFRTHRDHPNAGLVISQPVASRVTHSWSLVLSRRLNDSHGNFAGVIAATIPLALIDERFARLKLGEHGSIGMRDGNLRLVLRHPELPDGGAVGSTQIADEFQTALEQDKSFGSYHAGATSIDGIQRFHSYRRNAQYGFYINVGVADDEYLAAWQRDALQAGIILGIFLLITAGFAVYMQRAWIQRQSLIDQLSKSESRFRNMFQHNDAVMLLIEPSSGVVVAANPAAARFYGYPIERLNGMRIDQINTLTPEEISKNRAKAINHEQNMFVFPHRLASGEVRTVEVRSSPIVTEERNLLFSIIQDITERKKAEDALRHLQKIYAAVVEADRLIARVENADELFAGICKIAVEHAGMKMTWIGIPRETDGRILPVTSHGDGTGYLDEVTISSNPDIPEGRGPTGTAYREGKTIISQDFQEDASTNPWHATGKSYGWRSSATFPISRSCAPYAVLTAYNAERNTFDAATITLLEGLAADISHAVTAIADNAERRRAEEDLRRSNAELEQFSYAVSHDMRQPLRMISSYLQLLDRELAGQLEEEKRSFLNYAKDGAQRLDQMLVGLLEYARVGRKGEPATWVESRLLLDEALLYLEPAITEARADVRVLGDWPRVNVSPNETLRLLQNLIGNAVKFRVANRKPEITLTSSMTDTTWRVSVADNGTGMAPDQIGRLFQVFQRLHSRAEYEGTGIGLALCRKIVEHHQGRIWAESAGNGHGSRFCVELPQRLVEVS